MSKKKKTSKGDSELSIRVVHAGASLDSRQDPNVPQFDRAITSMSTAEPGWRAVFLKCKEHEIEEHRELDVIFWTVIRWDSNNMTDVCGLVHGPGGRFYEAPVDPHFIGYARPGQLMEEVLEHYRSP